MESASQVGDLAGIGPRLAGLAERVAGDAALLRRGRHRLGRLTDSRHD